MIGHGCLQAVEQLIGGGIGQQLLATNPGPAMSAPEAHSGDRGCFGGRAAGSGTLVDMTQAAGHEGKNKGKGKGKTKGGGKNDGKTATPKTKPFDCTSYIYIYMHVRYNHAALTSLPTI